MEFLQAFPIAIIDEDYEGKRAAGRGMRQLAAAIEKEGFRVVAGAQLRGRPAAGRTSSTTNPAGWCRSTAPRTGAHAMADPGGGARPPSAAATTGCRSSSSATSAPRRWCRQAC